MSNIFQGNICDINVQSTTHYFKAYFGTESRCDKQNVKNEKTGVYSFMQSSSVFYESSSYKNVVENEMKNVQINITNRRKQMMPQLCRIKEEQPDPK
jgi:hypothetical protein